MAGSRLHQARPTIQSRNHPFSVHVITKKSRESRKNTKSRESRKTRDHENHESTKARGVRIEVFEQHIQQMRRNTTERGGGELLRNIKNNVQENATLTLTHTHTHAMILRYTQKTEERNTCMRWCCWVEERHQTVSRLARKAFT